MKKATKHTMPLFFKTALLSIFLLLTLVVSANENYLIISGVIEDDGDAIPGCDIAVTTNSTHTNHTMSDELGIYELRLLLGNVYTIVFSKEHYTTKRMYIDARLTGSVQMKTDFEFPDNVRIDMFQEIDGLNINQLSEPLVKIKYNKENNRFEYDEQYMAHRNAELGIVWEKVEADRKEKKNVFDEQMKLADNYILQKNYDEAIVALEKAMIFRPFSSSAKTKLEIAKSLSGKYLNVQNEVLPDSYTEEVKSRNNKTITRKTVVLNNIKTVYTKVEHHTGQIFYFKNSQPVTSWFWEKETSRQQ